MTACPNCPKTIYFNGVDPGAPLICRYYPTTLTAPIILYYPRVNEFVDSFEMVAKNYNKFDLNIFFLTYRDRLKTGEPFSLAAILVDAKKRFERAVVWLKENGYTGPLFVMGHSLGSFAAIDTVLDRADDIKGMIIGSGICEPVSFLNATDKDPNEINISSQECIISIKKIEKIKLPTLILHGAKDNLISIAQAEKLQVASGAKNKQFYIIPAAGHSTLVQVGADLYFKTIKEFIDTVCGVNTWRRKRKNFRK